MQVHRRDPQKEMFWRLVLEEFQASGLSIRAFCRQEGLSEPSFYSWRRELRQRDEQFADGTQTASNRREHKRRPAAPDRNSKAAQLVPVMLVDHEETNRQGAVMPTVETSGQDEQVEIETPGGCRVRFHSAIEVAHLGDLLQTVMRCETSADDESPV